MIEPQLSAKEADADAETGLDYFGARYYSGAQGRSSGGTTPYVTGVSYAPQGALQLISYGGGNYEQTCYNSRLQVQAMVLRTTAPGDASVCTGAASPLWQLALDYGSANNGNLMTQTVGDGAGWSVAQTYSYDKLNRVLSAEEPSITGGQGWKRSYNYDRWGNQWVDATNSSGINVYSVTPTGSAWITPKNRINLSAGSFDRAGNQISLPPYSATYDADNRLTTMSGTLAYAYDGEGRRVKKVNGKLATRYVYDAFGNLAAEYAVGTALPGAPQPECSTCYLTVDHLGSTRVLWDSAGVKGRYDYMPFGDAIPSDRNKRDSVSCASGVTACYAGSGSLTMRFTGKERDAETSNSAMGDGLDYFGARYFSGAQGRFTTPDWSEKPEPVPYADLKDPQSLNLYAYVRNNPLTNRDPDGHVCFFGFGNTCASSAPLPMPRPIQPMDTMRLLHLSRTPRTTSAEGLDFIKQVEGSRKEVYPDSAGNPTIGVGHLIRPGEDFSGGITDSQATGLLVKDLGRAERAVNRGLEVWTSQNQFDALESFTFNVGGGPPGGLSDSTLLGNINANETVTKGNFTDYNKAKGKVVPGLTKRREKEYDLYSNGTDR